MSYIRALPLGVRVEGGYVESHPPEGRTFAGILESTWNAYNVQRGWFRSWPPTAEDVGTFYHDAFWIPRFCDELPEPADEVALQMFINLPFVAGNRVLQCALQVYPDGIVGLKTRDAFLSTQPMDLAERILIAQTVHYCNDPFSSNFRGLIARVQTVRDYLKQIV